jgi:isopenicillin-N epimerase
VRAFGRAWLDQWLLDPAIRYLNHGTVGAPPARVLAAQQAIRDEIERQPSRFLLRELVRLPDQGGPSGRLRTAAAAVAAFVGARSEDLVFVDNATTGANAVLRSLDLGAGDEILVTDLTYGAVRYTAAFVARQRGATVTTITMPHPVREPGELVDAFVRTIGPRTRLAIVDHVTSESAIVMPVAAIAAACRAKGVAVLVDGAHAPGAFALDVPSLGVDWYTANLHKWAWAPRSSAFLWTAPARQRDVHPTVTSWGFDQGYVAEFDTMGTRDPSTFLAAPAALDLMREVGLERIWAWNHALAWESARRLCARWETAFTPEERLIGTMATLPLPERLGSTREDAQRLRDALLFEDRIEVQLHAFRNRLWARISAQIYTDASDMDALGAAIASMSRAARP